jgi:hypothetical protein
MKSSPARVPAVRVRHYQGERLLAPDLQDEYDSAAWLRALHVVGLHDTWGIALGFDVSLVSAAQGSSVLVQPGLAFDVCGRELVLGQAHAVPVPPRLFPGVKPEGPYDLVMSNDGTRRRREMSPCTGEAGAAQLDFAWRRPGERRLGLEVPLASYLSPDAPLDLSVRRYARPLIRPHIAAGITPPEQPWQIWTESASSDRSPFTLGVQTNVDTSAAGFVGTPYYFASVRFDLALLEGPGENLPPTYLLFSSIVWPSPTGFTFRLMEANQPAETAETTAAPRATTRIATLAVRRTRAPVFQVSWLGIEPVAGSGPRIFRISFPPRIVAIATGESLR